MILSVLARLVIVTIVWVAATEAAMSALSYALVIVPLVVAASYVITGRPARGAPTSPRGFVARVGAILTLVGYVVGASLTGAFDVARRALVLPRPDIDPEWMTYRTTLTSRSGRVAFALLMNLTPGTLSSRLEDDMLDVHIIDGGADIPRQLAALEKRIARIERVVDRT